MVKVSSFLGEKLPSDVIDTIVDKLTFDNMKKGSVDKSEGEI